MYFDNVNQIKEIAERNGTAVFVVPSEVDVNIQGAIVLKPETKTVITIEQVREVMRILMKKQVSEVFVIIRPAELMNREASNAFLKNLEEPQDKVHFVLITNTPSKILPTILSRSAMYFLKPNQNAFNKISADENTTKMAKKVIAAKPQELIDLAEEISKKKTGVRQYALDVLGTAIEILYKTYLINQKSIFLKKIPKFLTAYDAISRNGHIKLHLVADLI